MSILRAYEYLKAVGIVTLALVIIWPYAMVTIWILFAAVKQMSLGLHLTRALGYYLYTSLIAMLTFVMIMGPNFDVHVIVYTLFGAVVVFVTVSNAVAGDGRNASRSDRFDAFLGRFDAYLPAVSVLYYFVAVFSFPSSFVANPLTIGALWAINWFINWVNDVPFLNDLVASTGILTVIWIVIQAALFLVLKSSEVATKRRPSPDSLPDAG